MNLKQLRQSKGISPSFVASKLNISYRHFHRIEKNGEYLKNDRKNLLAMIYSTTKTNIERCIKESR